MARPTCERNYYPENTRRERVVRPAYSLRDERYICALHRLADSMGAAATTRDVVTWTLARWLAEVLIFQWWARAER